MAGIYIHIPFCKQACTYCNFHFSTSLKGKGNFLDALRSEILIDNDFISSKESIGTIYFGGGTPSLLQSEEIKNILDTLREKFVVEKNVEISLEANPDDINAEVLNNWLVNGINRISLGVQSFSDAELKWMNRAHTAEESLQSIDTILTAGFTNFSVDLIYGSPLLSNEDLIKNVGIIAERNIPHLSCYALTVEPKTALYKMINQHTSLPIDPDKQAEQFELLLSLTTSAGYEQYEISNFAKPGYRSRHNTSYWQGIPYHGFGPAAHSYNGINKRRWNVSNNTLYVQAINMGSIPFEEEILSPAQSTNEYIMTSLRTMEGINLKTVEEKFGEHSVQHLLQSSVKFINSGSLFKINDQLCLTAKGKFLADGIAADLFI